MLKLMKWVAFLLGSLVVVLLLAIGVVYAISAYRFNRIYEVEVSPSL